MLHELPDREPTLPRNWRYRCGRCGNMTDGHSEGGVEFCTACGGVLGPMDEIEYPPSRLENERLLKFAATHHPPQSWYDEDFGYPPHNPDTDPCGCADCCATTRPKKGAGLGYQLIVNDTTDNSLAREQLARERAERKKARAGK